MVNALMAILLARLTGGFMGWLLTTILIVYFGEILPQSVCSRHGLLFGSLGSPVVWVAVVLLFPVTKLYAIVLDYLFPDEESLMDGRGWRDMVEYLQHVKPGSMPAIQSTMLLGSLDLEVTCVREVMVPMEEACLLEADEDLTFDKLMWIQQKGFTRLPVYDKRINRCIGLLHCKDLLRRDLGADIYRGNTLCAAALLDALARQGHRRELCQIWESMSLLDLLALFKQGKPHLVVVCAEQTEADGESEHTSRHVGIATLQNVYQIILSRGNDPFSPRSPPSNIREGAIRLFTQPRASDKGVLPEAQMRAIQAFLQQTQPCFAAEHISESELWKVLKEKEVSVLRKGKKLYKRDERSQTATIVLVGQIEVSAGKDGFVSRVGLLAVLGMQALEPPVCLLPALRASFTTELLLHHDVHDYIPDFSATVVSSEGRVLRIHRREYLEAYGRTQIETVRKVI
eukprot:gnl/TRDRNA2_/TRDRNA2_67466_c0_seq1.p1 gnl/TRDRNA2_/TRDRNA2_67466_c0~~gnl/TRDRNA2_/TRDRNA2_67466_c0_seq1.p1  ORF type:complete len:457 (+),score=56.67 gnl/TRDRNA2_/TRDRNA2_67466_c0_seq1:305-1675(+)